MLLARSGALIGEPVVPGDCTPPAGYGSMIDPIGPNRYGGAVTILRRIAAPLSDRPRLPLPRRGRRATRGTESAVVVES